MHLTIFTYAEKAPFWTAIPDKSEAKAATECKTLTLQTQCDSTEHNGAHSVEFKKKDVS